MAYILKSWQQVKDRKLAIADPEFARHLRDISRDRQIAYVRLMGAVDGKLVAVECRHETREAWAFVLPNVSSEEKWRVQYFDPDGFSRHACFDTTQEAIESMVSEGYSTLDQGALDRQSATDRWSKGISRSSIHQKACSGIISWEEAYRQMSVV